MEEGDDFAKWIGSVEMYMTAINVTRDAQKKAIVLHLLGPDMQETYKNLPFLEDEDEETENYLEIN